MFSIPQRAPSSETQSQQFMLLPYNWGFKCVKRYTTIDVKESAYVLVLGVTIVRHGLIMSYRDGADEKSTLEYIHELTRPCHHYKMFERKAKVPVIEL